MVTSTLAGLGVVLKGFDAPDDVRQMQKGRFETVTIGGLTIGRATYEPGWRWSEHVGPSVGATRCHVEHVGLVISGAAAAAFDDGRVEVQDHVVSKSIYFKDPDGHEIEITTYETQNSELRTKN